MFLISIAYLRSIAHYSTTVSRQHQQEQQQRHRDRYNIVNDILQMVSNNPIIKRRHKTGIGYAANLTHWQTITYLKRLIGQDLLRQISDDLGPYSHYEITRKGERYLQVFAEIEDDLRPTF
jgi:predicted transcriptional regulator